MPTIAAAAITDIGRVRFANEDAVFAADPVYVVADGMGGHAGGRLASAAAVAALAALTRQAAPLGQDQVRAALGDAQGAVRRLAERGQRRAAGTTISGAVVISQDGQAQWLIVNLGDSRTYRFADGVLEQLTVDHSEVQELVDAGRISPAQARSHPRRHVVTRALGAGVDFEPDCRLEPLRAGDRLLVCSDGLTGEVDDRRIERLLAAWRDPSQAARALVDEALRLGGADNVSVVVADVIDAAPWD
ncbi:MAG: protein phosphatase 2C domain-containing protein [Bifidobacteriaceae bacterium]|jgi:protein phosphatase|nr:protein phosphatase 2C domain-containing protein [Bifidobacteriaceae bacterium]